VFLEESPIPLAPLAEQRRIIARIEALFQESRRAREALDRVSALITRFRQSVLTAAFRGDLTERDPDDEPASALLARILAERRRRWEEDLRAQGKGPERHKYDEPALFDVSDLPRLPEGWVWASLPQIGELARGKSKHRPRNDRKLFDGPYPFIQTGDVHQANGIIQTYNETYNELGLAQSRLRIPGIFGARLFPSAVDSSRTMVAGSSP
jgi:type I restriction enzyme, S subunit